jgi:O-antigen/teichoic acid export membrane protein
MRVLALLTVPACFMQAAMARPGFELVFKPKWAPAIPVMQVLCLGMAIRCVGLTVGAVNMARRRYRLQLLLSFIYCVLFLATMAVAARLGAALAVAAAEAGFYIVVDPINMAVILYLNGERPLRELARIFAKPLIAAVIAVGAAWAISQTVPPFRGALVARLAIIGLVSVGIYLPLSRKIMPGTWNELAAFRRSKTAPQASSL